MAAHQDGDLAAAEQGYRAVLAAQPDHVAALRHLGILRVQQGRPAEAIELARKVLEHAPDAADSHTDLATALAAAGQADAAVTAYEDALMLAPDHPEANYGLATVLHALGRYDEAVACYQRALSADPEYPEAERGLGLALQATGRYEMALDHYQNALALNPDYVEARQALGSVLQVLRRHGEAAEAYRLVLAAEPDHVDTLVQYGRVLQSLDRHGEALAHLARACELRPDPNTLLRYGDALQESGRIDDAAACYRHAIGLAPADPRGYLALFRTMQPRPDDSYLAAALALDQDDARLDEHGRMTLHFALGRALSAIGREADAFRHTVAGNALQRLMNHYDEAAALGALQRTAAIFTPELIAARRGAGSDTALPIFIVGMPRCGSSLTEQILASHPAVAGGGERSDLGHAIDAVCGADSPAYPDLMARLSLEQQRQIGDRYAGLLARVVPPDRPGVTRVTDKRLENFALVGLIHLVLPRARIIHVRRDPLDICMSCFTTLFAEVPYASDLGELGRYCGAYLRLMAHWRSVLPPDAMLEIDYEALVDDARGQVARMLDYCALPWDEACLAFHQTERPVRTASMAQVRQPLYRSSIGRWRPDDETLRPLLDGLAATAA